MRGVVITALVHLSTALRETQCLAPTYTMLNMVSRRESVTNVCKYDILRNSESPVESSFGYWLHSAVIQSPHLFDKKLLACLGRCVTRSCICTQFANNLQTISSSWVHLSTGLPVTLTAPRHAADWAFITSSRHSALMGCATVFKSSIRKLERKVSTGVIQSAASLICCSLNMQCVLCIQEDVFVHSLLSSS